jgi:hypothetical protein
MLSIVDTDNQNGQCRTEDDINYLRYRRSLMRSHILMIYSEFYDKQFRNYAFQSYYAIDFNQKYYKTKAWKLLLSDLNYFQMKGLINAKTKEEIIKQIKNNNN